MIDCRLVRGQRLSARETRDVGRRARGGVRPDILIMVSPSPALRSVLRSWRLLAVTGLLVLLGATGRAWASADQTAMFQDNQLLLGDPVHLDQTLRDRKTHV